MYLTALLYCPKASPRFDPNGKAKVDPNPQSYTSIIMRRTAVPWATNDRATKSSCKSDCTLMKGIKVSRAPHKLWQDFQVLLNCPSRYGTDHHSAENSANPHPYASALAARTPKWHEDARDEQCNKMAWILGRRAQVRTCWVEGALQGGGQGTSHEETRDTAKAGIKKLSISTEGATSWRAKAASTMTSPKNSVVTEI